MILAQSYLDAAAGDRDDGNGLARVRNYRGEERA